MKSDRNNTWLNENGMEQIDFYTKASDYILVERNRTIKILIDIYDYHFEKKKNMNLLDLGCGDGILAKSIFNRYPDNEFYLLDGCKEMLEKAEQDLNKYKNFKYINCSFEEYINAPEERKYSFIFSSNAIHHMDYLGKMNLYTKIYKELEYGGLFLNIDLVLPSSKYTEVLQFRMWKDWINENLYKNDFQDEIGNYDDISIKYKNKDENKPSSLFEQLRMLERIGFRDVDCFYKYSIFTVFGGVK